MIKNAPDMAGWESLISKLDLQDEIRLVTTT